MRFLVLALLTAMPARAWEFTAVPVCTLSHEGEAGAVEVTYDPSAPQPYAITVTRNGAWADGPVFSIWFEGPSNLTISTDRHRMSGAQKTLTVRDRGFGNVLNGLEFGDRAVATVGNTSITLPLAGAALKVRDFRACTAAPSV